MFAFKYNPTSQKLKTSHNSTTQKRDTHIGIPFSINNYFNYSRRALPVAKFK